MLHQQSADQSNGDFQIGSYFVSGATSLATFSAMLHDQNYTASGTYAGKRGIGLGPQANVPGLGKIDIPSTIYQQSRGVGPGSEMNKLTWDWAQLVNQQVPYIWYGTKITQMEYTTTNFTNWPPTGVDWTSDLWNIVGDNTTGGIALALEQGYIVPKH